MKLSKLESKAGRYAPSSWKLPPLETSFKLFDCRLQALSPSQFASLSIFRGCALEMFRRVASLANRSQTCPREGRGKKCSVYIVCIFSDLFIFCEHIQHNYSINVWVEKKKCFPTCASSKSRVLECKNSSVLSEYKVLLLFPTLFLQHPHNHSLRTHIQVQHARWKARASSRNMKGFESHSRATDVAPFFIQKD